MGKIIHIKGEGDFTYSHIAKIPRLAYKFASKLREEASNKKEFDENVNGIALRSLEQQFKT